MNIEHRQFNLLTQQDVDQLFESCSGACVSIYMPTHNLVPEVRQDPIRFKNLIRDAELQLAAGGMSERQARAVVDPAFSLVHDNAFWRRARAGLAAFLGCDQAVFCSLPMPVTPVAVAGDRFFVTPLIPMITDNGRFLVLCLNQNGLRLYEGTKYTFEPLDISGIPPSLEEHLKVFNFELTLQTRTGTGSGSPMQRAGMFHGQGGAADDANMRMRILEYFRRVDNGVRALLADDQRRPLILAGISDLRGIYREANHYNSLLDDGIDGNPTELREDELHRLAWEKVLPFFRQRRVQAAETYEILAGHEDARASHKLEAILPAAVNHRVDTLFLLENSHCWGQFDPQHQHVEIHAEAKPGDNDLLNLAAGHVLSNAGEVFMVGPNGMINADKPAAAIFRY